MNRGILTIALKHPLYGRYAYNLALSIKACDPKQKISVIADDIALSHLHEGQKLIFDRIIKPKKKHYFRGDKCVPLICKFYLNELTPYKEETQFVDSDMVFSQFANFDKLWNDMNEVQWTMANRGINEPNKGISEWVDSSKLKEAYPNISTWYDLSSEWMYWKTGELSDSIFKKAVKYYDEGKLMTRSFAGDKPDEPFFCLALNDVNHYPHKLPWQPTYWQPAIRKIHSIMEIKKQWYAFSAGGNHLPPFQKKIYDEMVKNASYKMNLNSMSIFNKRNQLKERTII